MTSSPQVAPSPLRKLRHYLAWPFAILLALFAKSTNQGFWWGVPVIVLGELVRIWSQGHLLKSRQLATDGPYAFVRHPLYVGNFLVGAGFCIIIWHPLVAGFFVLSFFSVYLVAIRLEEKKLRDRFEPAFIPYAQSVPSFLPRLTPYPYRSKDPFVWRRVWGHGEHITILAILSVLLGVYLRQALYQEARPVTEVMELVAGTVLVVGGLTFFQMRRRAKSN